MCVGPVARLRKRKKGIERIGVTAKDEVMGDRRVVDHSVPTPADRKNESGKESKLVTEEKHKRRKASPYAEISKTRT